MRIDVGVHGLGIELDDIVEDSRWDMTYLGMQVLIEGLALAAFASLPLAASAEGEGRSTMVQGKLAGSGGAPRIEEIDEHRLCGPQRSTR